MIRRSRGGSTTGRRGSRKPVVSVLNPSSSPPTAPRRTSTQGIPESSNKEGGNDRMSLNPSDLQGLTPHTFTVVESSDENIEKLETVQTNDNHQEQTTEIETTDDTPTQQQTEQHEKELTHSTQKQKEETESKPEQELKPANNEQEQKENTDLKQEDTPQDHPQSSSRKSSTNALSSPRHEDEVSSASVDTSRNSIRLRSSSQLSAGVNTASSVDTLDSPVPGNRSTPSYSIEKCSRSWRTALEDLRQAGIHHSDVYRGPRWKMMLEMKRLC